MFDEAGLAISPISSAVVRFSIGVMLMDSHERNYIKGRGLFFCLIEVVTLLGAPVVSGGFMGLGRGKAGYRHYLKALIEEAEKASGHWIPVALEAVNRYELDYLQTPEETLDFVESTCCDNMKTLLDIFHINIEEASIELALRTCRQGERLTHVHISESNRRMSGKEHLDFKPVCAVFSKFEYAGALSSELEWMPVDEEEAVLDNSEIS
jgi:sugar phosphate isomerase/epimerase